MDLLKWILLCIKIGPEFSSGSLLKCHSLKLLKFGKSLTGLKTFKKDDWNAWKLL